MSNTFINRFIERAGESNAASNTSVLPQSQQVMLNQFCTMLNRQSGATINSIIGDLMSVNFTYLKEDAEKKPSVVHSRAVIYDLIERILSIYIGDYRPEWYFDDENLVNFYRVGSKGWSARSQSSPPPGLETQKFQQLMDIIEKSILLTPSQVFSAPEVYQRMHRVALRILHHVSIINVEDLTTRVENNFKTIKSDDFEGNEQGYRAIRVIEVMELGEAQLVRIISSVASLITSRGKAFKTTFFTTIVKSMRLIIWNYFRMHPSEMSNRFNKKNSTCPLSQASEALFNLLESIVGPCVKSTAKPNEKALLFWPLMVDLMILSPLMLADNLNALKKISYMGVSDSKVLFLEHLVKCRSDVGVECATDLVRAASFTSKTDFDEGVLALKGAVSDAMPMLRERILTNNEDFLKEGADGIGYIINFIVSAHRIDLTSGLEASADALRLVPTAHPLFVFCVCKALQVLTDEAKLHSWCTLLHDSRMYQSHAGVLRIVFKNLAELHSDVDGPLTPTKASSPLLSKKPSMKLSSKKFGPSQFDTESLGILLDVFESNPILALENTAKGADLEKDIAQGFFGSLAACLELSQVQARAIRTLRSLFRPDVIAKWWPENIPIGIIEVTSAVFPRVLQCIKNDEFGLKSDGGAQTILMLELLKDLLKGVNTCLQQFKVAITPAAMDNMRRLQTLKKMDDDIQQLLCSHNNAIWANTVWCLGELLRQLEILGEVESQRNVILLNKALYSLLYQNFKDKWLS